MIFGVYSIFRAVKETLQAKINLLSVLLPKHKYLSKST